MDECANAPYAPARCRPEAEADNRGEACPSIDGQAKTGNLMGPRVYPWGSISREMCGKPLLLFSPPVVMILSLGIDDAESFVGGEYSMSRKGLFRI